jgi:hypothetical protein
VVVAALSALALLLGPTTAAATAAPAPSATLVAFGTRLVLLERRGLRGRARGRDHPGTIALLGDERPTSAARRRSSGSATRRLFGRFLQRTQAALGKPRVLAHGNADAAIAYFKLPRRGYYSYDLGAWHVVVLNSNCSRIGGCGPTSRRTPAAARPRRPHPRPAHWRTGTTRAGAPGCTAPTGRWRTL